MTFEDVIERIAKNNDVEPLRYYLFEDVLIALAGDKIVRGRVIEHQPFYSPDDDPLRDGILMDFTSEAIKIVMENEDYEVLKSADIQTIKRITNTNSFFNIKQIAYIKELGIDPEKVRTNEEFVALYRKELLDEYKKKHGAEQAEVDEKFYKSIYDKIKAICPEIISKMEKWKVEPFCIEKAMQIPSEARHYQSINVGLLREKDEEITAESVISQIDEANEFVMEGNISHASRILYELTRNLTNKHKSIIDGEYELHSFEDIFGKILYTEMEKPYREIIDLDIPYARAYFAYGSCLFEDKQYELAECELDKALLWDPFNPAYAFEHAEIAKVKGDLKRFYQETMKIMEYAYRPTHIARGYRNIGYYFIEKGKYRYALICYALSLIYESNDMAKSEIIFIAQKNPDAIADIPFKEVEEFVEEHNMNIGASKEVKSIAKAIFSKALEVGNIELARYFYNIYHEIEDDLHTKLMLETLRVPKKWKLSN